MKIDDLALPTRRERGTQTKRESRKRRSEADILKEKLYQQQYSARTGKARHLKRHYGLTVEKWNQLFDSQGKRCAICKSPETSGKDWHTDHEHSTGKVRGILCHHCNLMLGNAQDSITTLQQGIEYLKGTEHMQLNFDATQYDPSQAVSICLPLADYPFTIVSADVEQVKDKQNEGLLKVGLRIDDGPYRGAVQVDRFNIYNANPQAVQIAYKELSALCHVTNRLRLGTEKDLIGGQGLATIGPQTNNDKYSEVKQYKYMNGALPGANGAAQQQPAQQAQPSPAFAQPQQQPAQQTQGFGQQPQQAAQPAFPPAPGAGPAPAFGQPQGGFQPQQQPAFGGGAPAGGGQNLPPWATK